MDGRDRARGGGTVTNAVTTGRVERLRGLGRFLTDAWMLAKPYFARSEERWSARLLLAAIVALDLSLVGMTVMLNFWNGAFFNSLQDKDFQAFTDLLLFYRFDKNGFLPGFCVIAAVYIAVGVYRTYLNQWLQVRWRRWMTGELLERWLSDRAYYRISLARTDGVSATDNPDQRIAEDMRAFIGDSINGTQGILQLSLELLSNVVTVVSFVAILWRLSGPTVLLGINIPGYMVWVALIYALLGSWMTHKVGKPLAALNFRQQRVEADFRFGLVRLRENVEGVALYGGEEEERRDLAGRFAALTANWWLIMQRTKLVNALTTGYGQIAIIFPYVVAAPRYFTGTLTLGDLTQTSGAFGRVQDALSWFVNSYTSLASWSATVERLATFERAIAVARAASDGPQMRSGPTYGFDDASIALPSGEVLVAGARLDLVPGQSVILTGRSGSGKSTLFRALAGIWPFGSGVVQRAPGTSLFLPQRPYFPLGTLRHAVCYPTATDHHSEDDIRSAISDVGLAHLLPRLDDDEPWGRSLSGGEQQRLAVARALLTAPDWLFLDEATASLDPAAEAQLYTLLRERLPHTAIISIAHRPEVAAYHERHVVLDRPGSAAGELRG